MGRRVNIDELPRSREAARAGGAKSFFTGEPCKAGHIAPRLTINGQCRGCSDANKRAWLAKHPERGQQHARAHYEANREDYIARSAQWRAANPKAARASAKRNRPKHAAGRVAWARRDRKAKPETYRTRVRNRRAKLAAGGTHTAEDIFDIARQQRYRCAYCPARICAATWETDHIIAVIRGGSNDRSNLQLLCRPCNRAKGAKDPIDFAREKELLL